MIPLHDDNRAASRPLVTVTILIACVLVFLWQLSLGEVGKRMVLALGLVPAVLFGNAQLPAELSLVPPPLTIVTSMFMHSGWLHLIGNMLYLWVFADNVEDCMGHRRFIIFYLLCGIGAALAQALPEPRSAVPMIGASGAVSGVLGAYLLLYPHARVLTVIPLGIWFPVVRIPAGVLLTFWFALQLVSNWLLQQGGKGGVAFRAHIGGFLVGILLIPVMKQRRVSFWAPPR
jgi:membrane associated rhomboid family serine protease